MSSRGITNVQTDMDDHSKLKVCVLSNLRCSWNQRHLTSSQFHADYPQTDARSAIQDAMSAVDASDEKAVSAHIKHAIEALHGPTVSVLGLSCWGSMCRTLFHLAIPMPLVLSSRHEGTYSWHYQFLHLSLVPVLYSGTALLGAISKLVLIIAYMFSTTKTRPRFGHHFRAHFHSRGIMFRRRKQCSF